VSCNFPVIDLEVVREPQVSIGVRREIAHQVEVVIDFWV
jgi:hypothetical protein